MKKQAEQEVKNLIRRVRIVCADVGDCPVRSAREPSQLDCIACVFRDISMMADELKALREFKAKVTEYGSQITKLECIEEPALLDVLKRQIKNGGTDGKV
jgi:hypothetical protein